jgi:hypothetical protein
LLKWEDAKADEKAARKGKARRMQRTGQIMSDVEESGDEDAMRGFNEAATL